MNKTKSFGVYIHRVLNNVQPKQHITSTALEAVDSILRTTANRLVARSLSLTDGVNKKTVSANEVETAVKLVLPAGLVDSTTKKAQTAVESFVASEQKSAEAKKSQVDDKPVKPSKGKKAKKVQEEKEVVKAQTRESRSGLIFSVSATEKFLRSGNSGHVASNTPVYLAAVLERLTEELLTLSGSKAQEASRVTINVRHLFLGVSSSELEHFVNSLGVVFLDSGVKPHIEDKLLQKKPRKRLPPAKNGSKRVHKWRPGTKALMNMKKLQKNSELLIQHAPFSRLVRSVAEKHQGDLRCTAEFLSALQSFVENRMVRVMSSANRIALHSNRETVYARDVELAKSFLETELVPVTVAESDTIPQAALRKLALRAGIKRYGDDSTGAYMTLLVELLESYVGNIVACAVHHKLRTLNPKLLIEALSMRGLFPTIVAHKRKTKKSAKDKDQSAETKEETGDVSDVENTAVESTA